MDKQAKQIFQTTIIFLCILFCLEVRAETLNCGLKKINVQNGKINEITHEDGTVHSGNSISDNWTYDGKSIKHRIMDEKIQCGSKAKSRNEIIDELASRFIKNPAIHGMNKQEAQFMTNYTANLMRTDENCNLLVDASKSTQRKDMFFIDCNDKVGNPNRYWVPASDMKSGTLKSAVRPVSDKEAISVCSQSLKSQTTNPATYDPSLLTGTTSRVVKSNGRNVVEINFGASNKLGSKAKFKGKCILESGKLIESVIEEL